MRFRKYSVAVTCDIQQMFYCFLVEEAHRDFLRFFWYKSNDPTKPLIEYRMTVHVFGNTPSPSVATYGLRKTVDDANPAVRTFVENNYVDDGLTSCLTSAEPIGLLKGTQQALSTANIKLHKIVSNSVEVMAAFPVEERAKSVSTLDIFADDLPSQASLGLAWNISEDLFSFNLNIPDKPFTKSRL